MDYEIIDKPLLDLGVLKWVDYRVTKHYGKSFQKDCPAPRVKERSYDIVHVYTYMAL